MGLPRSTRAHVRDRLADAGRSELSFDRMLLLLLLLQLLVPFRAHDHIETVRPS